jgi:antitoxin (DNA-binding transcriptional repressor) of toxin-antitoxin stability system
VKTLKLSAASRPLAEYASELSDEIVLVTQRNKAVAALVPLKGVDRESIALSGHPGFMRLIERSRAQFARGETMTMAEMRRAFATGRSPNEALQPTSRARRKAKSRRRSGAARG